MTVSYTLSDAHDGTDIAAVHDGVVRGVSPQDSGSGWGKSRRKLAEPLESRS